MKYAIFSLLSCFSCLIFAADGYKTNILKDDFNYSSLSKSSIDIKELIQGCPYIDCIPAVFTPNFELIKNVNYLRRKDIMMTVEYNGVTKVYPRKIMQIHEVVNDNFAGMPLIITYCPLCGTSIAYEPILDGEVLQFGVSGLLHNSDLVLYDKKTKSLWQQLTGRAIVGPLTGNKLKMVSVGILTWDEVKSFLPNAMVLKRPLKRKKTYKKFIYQDYSKSSKINYPVSAQDTRLFRKNFVYGVEIDGEYIAFEEKYLKKRTPLVETWGDYTLVITYSNGKVLAYDKKSNKQFNVVRSYWFAWFSFHPETQLRK